MRGVTKGNSEEVLRREVSKGSRPAGWRGGAPESASMRRQDADTTVSIAGLESARLSAFLFQNRPWTFGLFCLARFKIVSCG